MNKQKNPKKPLIYYYAIAMIILMLLNTFVFPPLLKSQITEVDYGTFLKQIESENIKQVEILDNQIAFISINEDGKEKLYVTGRMDDPDLVNRLYKEGVEFSRIIPKETSPYVIG